MLQNERRGVHEKTRQSVQFFGVSRRYPWSLFSSLTLAVHCLFTSVSTSFAHPISLTESVIDVHQNRIDLELKVLVEDLVLFYPVSTDEADVFPAEALQEAAESHRSFVADGLKLLDQGGRRLPGKIVAVDSSRIPDDGVAQTEIKQVSVSYVMQYATPLKPQFLTVSQHFGGDHAILPAMMDCQVKQSGVVLDVPQPIMSGQALTTRFDWSKPPVAPKNWKELKQRRNNRLKQQLGIASYSGLYSFLYITPHEVRHEILIPLLTMDEWTPIERKNSNFLEVAEQKAAATSIARFFETDHDVRINDTEVKPVVTRLNFFGLDISDFAMNAEPRRVNVAQARVGIILSYPSENTPTHVVTEWKTFSRYAPFLKSIIYEFDKEPEAHFFRPDQSEFKWSSQSSELHNLTVAEPPKSDGRRPTEAQSKQISSVLVQNIYRAFAFHEERKTYAALRNAVNGPLLRTLYLQIRRSLLMAEQGGSRSRVLSVKPVAGKLIGATSPSHFEMEYSWRVVGEVEHWGHIHTRENEYVAKLSVRNTEGYWKLEDVKFLSQKRIRLDTRLRQGKTKRRQQ